MSTRHAWAGSGGQVGPAVSPTAATLLAVLAAAAGFQSAAPSPELPTSGKAHEAQLQALGGRGVELARVRQLQGRREGRGRA